MTRQALIVIDPQNDYFPGGQFPLWNAENTLANIQAAIATAHQRQIPVILVQHVADSSKGISLLFNAGTNGVEIHPALQSEAESGTVVVKMFADAFYQTKLEQVLAGLGVSTLLLCGMMTQNCVTHTALSKAAEKYQVKILEDCCTTVSEIIHRFALNAIANRIALISSAEL
jgi:nicotinamidase-related amidase